MKPIIAIVGRPNVGKSTLFNRIVGRRQALVNDVAGVTRDRHYGNAEWCGKEFILIDTGGIVEGDDKSIQSFIKKQTLMAIDEADIIICLFDGREGPTHVDKSIVSLLRKSGKPVMYAVNKINNVASKLALTNSRASSAATMVNQFYEIGIKDIFAVSAEHGIGVDDLLDKVIQSSVVSCQSSVTDDRRLTTNDHLRISVIGRPNAGKSTLINRLAGQERVIAHEMPGTTRDSIDVEITLEDKKYIFVDTAGLKRKGKTLEALDKYSAIKSLNAIERSTIVLLMVDANDGFTHQDSSLLDYAYSYGKGVIVLFNKWDDLKSDAKKLKDFYEEKLLKLHHVPFLCISAKTGLNIDALFEEIEKIRGRMECRLATSELNKALEEVKTRHNIPTYKGKAVKLYYITQVKINPPSFMVFTNAPEGIGEGYKRYLINCLQELIGNGVPIRIKFKSKN